MLGQKIDGPLSIKGFPHFIKSYGPCVPITKLKVLLTLSKESRKNKHNMFSFSYN